MRIGTVAYFGDRGYGFLKPDDSAQSDVFVHATALPEGFDSLPVGTRVSFEEVPGKDGKPRAVNVKLI